MQVLQASTLLSRSFRLIVSGCRLIFQNRYISLVVRVFVFHTRAGALCCLPGFLFGVIGYGSIAVLVV